MKKNLIAISSAIFLLASCGEKVFTGNVDCNDCDPERPASADLVIDFTVNNKYPAVPFTVYYGDFEDNKIAYTDTAYATPYYVNVPVDRNYSVKAEYKSEETIVYVIDGTKLKVLAVTEACELRCFVIENEKLDARLKQNYW